MPNSYLRIKSYLKYHLKAKTRHSIHSPFVYSIIDNIIKDSTLYSQYTLIEHSLKSVASNNRIVETTDFGKVSENRNYELRFESISHIYKTSSVSKKYGRLLYRLVGFLQPKTIIEIGTSLGVSTSYIAMAAPNSRIFSLEGCSVKSQVAESLFEKLQISNVELHIGRFENTLPEAINLLPQIDFAFIDGNHRYTATIKYFKLLLSKIGPNSCFVFDDIHWSADMEKAWNEISNNEAVRVSIDLYRFGIIFFNQELSKQKFVIR